MATPDPKIADWPWRGTMEPDPRGFIRVAWPDGHRLTREDALKSLEVLKKINAEAGGMLRPLLVEMANVKVLTQGAREVFGSQEAATTCTAVALVGGNPLANMIANVFIAIRSKLFPAKLFSNREAAIEWLTTLK